MLGTLSLSYSWKLTWKKTMWSQTNSTNSNVLSSGLVFLAWTWEPSSLCFEVLLHNKRSKMKECMNFLLGRETIKTSPKSKPIKVPQCLSIFNLYQESKIQAVCVRVYSIFSPQSCLLYPMETQGRVAPRITLKSKLLLWGSAEKRSR